MFRVCMQCMHTNIDSPGLGQFKRSSFQQITLTKTVRKKFIIPKRQILYSAEQDDEIDTDLDDTTLLQDKITKAVGIFRSSERYQYREAHRNHFEIKHRYY